MDCLIIGLICFALGVIVTLSISRLIKPGDGP